MFWRRFRRKESEERPRDAGTIERDEPRQVAIQRVAEVLEGRGGRVVGLYEEVTSPLGRVVLPIHLQREPDEDVFFEIVTGPWEQTMVEDLLRSAAALRSSSFADATLEVLSAYPIPDEAKFFSGRSAAALFQLDLFDRDGPGEPEARAGACARVFAEAAERHLNLYLDYEPEELPQVEERLLAVFGEEMKEGKDGPPIVDALVNCLGCYAGESLRRRAGGSWRAASDWGDDLVVELPDATADPIGKARAFFERGAEDSVAFYVAYVLKELAQEPPESQR